MTRVHAAHRSRMVGHDAGQRGTARVGKVGHVWACTALRVHGRGSTARVRRLVGGLAAVIAVVATVPSGDLTASTALPAVPAHGKDQGPRQVALLRLRRAAASDGRAVRQAGRGARLPGPAPHGAKASDNGLLTQAAANTGAGWYTLATGAWPGVHGSTNNTFHINGQPFANRTGAFDLGVLQAETLAQAAERGGKKVAQIEWAGGRNGEIDGPTVDFRTFLSGRGVATNYISPSDSAAFVTAFGLQFDHPTGFAGQAPFLQASPTDAAGWTNVPQSFSPPKEMRLRVLDFGVDKYGLNAYIYDSRNDRRTRYDRVLFSPTKDGDDAVGNLRQGQWADVKVSVVGGALDGKPAAFLVKVERLASDLSQVRLFHTSVTRAIATWPTWPGEPGFTGDFEDFIAQRFPSSQAGDFAVLEAGIVSEETYVEQGLYWEKLYHPLISYIMRTHQPDLALVGYPVTDEFQHQFLGLVTRISRTATTTRRTTTSWSTARRDGRVKQREAFIRRAYKGADATMRLAQRRLREDDLTTFVSSDHGFAPQFLAIDASKVLVDLGLLSRPQTGELPPRYRRDDRQGQGLLGRRHRPDLPESRRPRPGRRWLHADSRGPRGGGGGPDQSRVPRPRDPNDWTHDGSPEGWTSSTAPSPRPRPVPSPTGPRSTTDMAHPTRTGDLVVFSSPPYQFDAATPGTLIALSAFFGQHGYVPDVQDLASNTNMRATFLAGGDAIDRGTVDDVRSIDLAPTAAFLLDIPVPQHNQGRVLLEMLDDGDRFQVANIIGLTDFHGQLDPLTVTINGQSASVGGASQLASMFDEEAAHRPGQSLLLASGDNVGASPPNSALLEDFPAIDVENAWGLDATSYGNHEFDFGLERLLRHQERANFPFLAANIVDEDTMEAPDFVQTSEVFTVNGVEVGVIGADVEDDSRARAGGRDRGAPVPRRGSEPAPGVGEAPCAGHRSPGRRDPQWCY